MKRVVVTDTVFPNLQPMADVLKGIAAVEMAATIDRKVLLNKLRRADAVVNCYAPVDAEMIGAMECCKIIARSGIGIDSIDLAAATAKNIKVTNVPDYCVDEVADHAMALILLLTRKLHQARSETASGNWDIAHLKPIQRLRGRVLGLLGFGKIARALAKRAAAFHIKTVFYDPHVPTDFQGAEPVASVAMLFERADILSLHAPLTRETRHIVNTESMRLLKRDTILINTSRGGLIDSNALIESLEKGMFGGVGLDVLEEETGASAARFGRFEHAIVTPHLGFYSEQSMHELQAKCAEDVKRVLLDQEPRYWLNRPH